jgi:hypothetical protein
VRYFFEPKSATWRTDGAWTALPAEKVSGVWRSVGAVRPPIVAAADRVGGGELVEGSPPTHHYTAGHVHPVSRTVAEELRAAGFADVVRELPDPEPPAPRTVASPVMSAAEARLTAELGDLREIHALTEARLAALEARSSKPEKVTTKGTA